MINHVLLLANTFGRWLFDHLWQMSLELAVLAAVVYVAIALLRVRSPVLRHMFWCLLLAKPVATFLVASPVSLYWFLNPRTEIVVQSRPGTVDPVPHPAPTYRVERRVVAGVPTVVPQRPAETRESLDRFGVLAAVWLAGCALLCLRLGFGFAYVSSLRRTSIPIRGGPLRDLVDQTARRLGCRSRVTIGVSSVPHGPVLAGIFRPVILVPEALVSRLATDQMRSIIAHELVHVRRRDNLILLIQRFAETLFFFHPVIWLGGRMMRLEAESACDDAVLARLGDSTTYADSLTRPPSSRWCPSGSIIAAQLLPGRVPAHSPS